MDDLLQKLILKFPFMSHVRYGDNEYIGIVQNRDNHCTSFYNYEKIKDPEQKKLFLTLGDAWWWESNRMIPINIFLRKEIDLIKYCQITMNSKDVKVILGPTVNLSNLSVKRVKRKNVQLIRKPKR